MTENERREMERMRRDAEQRVREMNQRAKSAVSGRGDLPMPHFVEPAHHRRQPQQPKPEKEPPKPVPAPAPQNHRGLGLLKMLNFQSLKLDNDILVIALLIMLLGSDDADELLLMALLYIMW